MMYMLQRFAIGSDQPGLVVRHTDFRAVVAHDDLGVAQVRGRHAGEQVMLDLIVQTTEVISISLPPLTFRDVNT